MLKNNEDTEQHIDIDALMNFLKNPEKDQEEIELQKWHKKYDIIIEKFYGYKINDCPNNDDELSYLLYTELVNKRKNSRKKYFSKIQKLFPDIWKQVLEYYKNGSLYDTEYCKIGE
jgi:molecular chaperone DnaK (HSP70)